MTIASEIKWREDRLDQIAFEYKRLTQQIEDLRAQQRTENQTPEQRRAQFRVVA